MTQKDIILRHFDFIGDITPMEAMQSYGIMRLASRINELRKDGHKIRTELVKGQNHFGEPTQYAKYHREEGATSENP